MLRTQLLFIVLLVLSISCERTEGGSTATGTVKKTAVDPHSYSNFAVINTEHLHLDLEVNFENKTVYGVARHTMNNPKDADTATFDIKSLNIQKVTLGTNDNEVETSYEIGENHPLKGQPLHVMLKPGTKQVNIYYQTTEKTESIDWLPKELTFGKKHPYMYTQGQAILTRSWIPVQDTPQNRITYSANVKVPKELIAVMSANNPKERNEEGVYSFEMKQAIPAYLIALAVGDMKYTSLGENSGVYSEPELAEACAYEFVDLPKMIKAAEKLYGPYRWDQYDLLVLPYSFPFGGMENP
ncbi:MAG: aminopeptidase, partial [Crocinitomicaceae bacterium]